VGEWMSECDTTAGTRSFFYFFFSSTARAFFFTPVLCSFLKTSQGGSVEPQLESKRHLLHPPPEVGWEGVGASAKGVWELSQQNAVPASSPLLSSSAAAPDTSLQRHLQL